MHSSSLLMLAAAFGLAPAALAQPEPVEQPSTELRVTEPFSLLVFSRTEGFRHRSIPDGIQALKQMGREHGFEVDATEDDDFFTDDNLEDYQAVVFLSTTGDVLDDEEEQAFKRFIEAGGGYVGIHAAADTEYDWPWYGELVGGYFKSHPHVQAAEIIVEDQDHPSTAHLDETWTRTDEWYDYRDNPRERRLQILMRLNTESYDRSRMDTDDHPIAWCHEYRGGRAWYTGGGHTSESFSEPEFREHMLGGILWAVRQAEDPTNPGEQAKPEGEANGAESVD